jgi:hypothetical protein
VISCHNKEMHEAHEFIAYTEVINVLDYTSLVIPVTHANKKIDIRPPYVPRSVNDCKNWNACRDTFQN